MEISLKKITLKGNPISKRHGHSSTFVYEKGIYIFGGTSKNQEILSDLFLIDTDFNVKKIQIYGNSPSLAYFSGFETFTEHSLILYGGFNGEGIDNNVYLFNHKTRKFSVLNHDELSKPHFLGSYYVVNGNLGMIGGYSKVEVLQIIT